MVELVDADGNVLARATDTNPNVIDVHDPVVPPIRGLTFGTALVVQQGSLQRPRHLFDERRRTRTTGSA